MTNIFLDGLPDEDMRGWKYDPDCHCIRCEQFYEAAYALVSSKETGEDIKKFYDQTP